MNDLPERPASHRSAGHAYQVRVEGRLSRAMVSYLGWLSRIEPGQSLVRVSAGPSDLADFLRSCSTNGLVVDRVTRVRS
jgi:hypothetical protein